MRKNRIREDSRYITVIAYAIVIILALICVYPMYYVLILSLSEPAEALTMNVYLWPKGFNLDAYSLMVKDANIWRTLFNTILYATCNTVLMITTCMRLT